MDRKVPFPTMPEAPREFNARWASDLIRSLDQMLALMYNPGEGRFTTATFTLLPTSDYGLENGALVLAGDQLHVVVPYKARPAGLSATTSIGTVSVTV